MAIVHLTAWVEDRESSYEDGLRLYREFGSSSFLLKLFEKGETVYTRERLREELTTLSQEIIENPDLLQKKGRTTKTVSSEPLPPIEVYQRPPVPENTSGYPEELQKKIALKGSLYKKCCFMHSQLLHMKSNDERKVAAEFIDSNFKKMQEIWDELDYYAEHKVLKSSIGYQFEKMTTYELIKRKNNLRTYISKHTGNEEKAAKLIEWADQIQVIDQLIENRN